MDVITLYNLGIDVDNYNPKMLYLFKKTYNKQNSAKCHYHDFVSMIYLLSGGSTYNINRTVYQLKKGDLIVLNPGVRHCRLMGEDQESMEFQIGFSDIYIKGLPDNTIIPEDSIPVFKLVRYEQDFLRCCSEIIAEQEKDQPACAPMLKSLLMKLIIIFLRENFKQEMSPITDPNLENKRVFNFEYYDKVNIVNEIMSYINENYMKDISLGKISKNMYLSPVYISKLFKEEAGESPINYLIQVRLAKALELLEGKGMTVKAAAQSVGYDDVYHFSKIFKKYYGKPPSRFRKRR